MLLISAPESIKDLSTIPVKLFHNSDIGRAFPTICTTLGVLHT